MIEIIIDIDLNLFTVINGSDYYEFESEELAIAKAEELKGSGNYFLNPMIDVDARYRG
jgi:hypothetical protein